MVSALYLCCAWFDPVPHGLILFSDWFASLHGPFHRLTSLIVTGDKQTTTTARSLTIRNFSYLRRVMIIKTRSRLDFQPLWESGDLSSSQLVWGEERGLTKRLEIEPRREGDLSIQITLSLVGRHIWSSQLCTQVRWDNFIYTRFFHQLIELCVSRCDDQSCFHMSSLNIPLKGSPKLIQQCSDFPGTSAIRQILRSQ